MAIERNRKRRLRNAAKVIDRWLDYQVSVREIPGLSFGIIDGKSPLLVKGYGYANLPEKRPATPTTCYRIASISKTFTAIALLQLVERSKLNLDDPVSKYLRWFRSAKQKDVQKITVRQLLSHSAGVTRDGSTGHWEDDHFPSLQQLKADIKSIAAVYKPLERFKYSNWGYAVLGQLLEVAAGMSYEKYLKQHIFRRLGLKHTSVEKNRGTAELLATGHGRRKPVGGREVFPYTATNVMAPAAGLISNVIDLCAFMAAQLPGNERLLKDYTKREMQRIQWIRTEGTIHYGLGYEIWQGEGKQLYGHGAGFSGYLGHMRIDAENQLGVVVLCNALGVPVRSMIESAYDTIHRFLEGKYELATKRKRVKNADRYEGRFTGRWEETDIVNIEGALWAFSPVSDKPMKEAMQLQQIDAETFKILTGDSFDYIGEMITFDFDKARQVRGIRFGPNRMTLLRRE